MRLKGKELDKWARLFGEVAILDMVKKGEISVEELEKAVKTIKEKAIRKGD